MIDRRKVLLLIKKNEYHKILKFVSKAKFTFRDVYNENNKGLVCKCNNKHKSALCVNLKPNDSFIAV